MEYPTDWEWIQRTFPYYQADPNAYRDAVNELQKMKLSQKSLQKINNIQWQFAGPDNIGG